MLFAVTYSVESLVIVGLAIVVVAFAAGWFLRKDTAEEENRRRVNTLVGRLRKANLDWFADIFENIVVEDISGLYQDIRAIAKMDGDEFMGILRKAFKAQFPDILKHPELGPFIREQIAAADAAEAAAAEE